MQQVSPTQNDGCGFVAGSVGPGAFLLWASYAGCNRTLVVALFCLGMASMGAFYPGMRVNALDLSPRHAGTIGALMNGIGAISGIAAPYAIGLIARNVRIVSILLIQEVVMILNVTKRLGYFRV